MVLRLSLAESLFMDLSDGVEDEEDEAAILGLLAAAAELLDLVVLLTLATFVPWETTEGQHW